MSDEHDAEPGTADTGPGRRRARVDHVGDELAALRRDVREHGGLLAEALPRLDDLAVGMGEVRAVLQRLVAEADEQDAEGTADLEARRAAGLTDEPPSPWAWPVLDRPTAQAAWIALGRWVAAVMCGQYRLTLGVLPICWAEHPGAVEELTALRAAHVAALRRGAHPGAALAWSRELPAALERLYGPKGTVDPGRCPPGAHHVAGEHQPTARERERLGALPCSPEAWWPALERVAAADVARRREPA